MCYNILKCAENVKIYLHFYDEFCIRDILYSVLDISDQYDMKLLQ